MHWAYIDELVFWGGSSGEGLILAPNAPIVDAAHRHGVPVLGNVFLPPVAYGGQLRWTRDLVQKDHEVKIAHEVQERLFPEHLPRRPGLLLEARNRLAGSLSSSA